MNETPLYYVTVRDAGRVGFLLGPYATHEEALASVERGRDLAEKSDPYSWFHAFGTTSTTRQIRTVFLGGGAMSSDRRLRDRRDEWEDAKDEVLVEAILSEPRPADPQLGEALPPACPAPHAPFARGPRRLGWQGPGHAGDL